MRLLIAFAVFFALTPLRPAASQPAARLSFVGLRADIEMALNTETDARLAADAVWVDDYLLAYSCRSHDTIKQEALEMHR